MSSPQPQNAPGLRQDLVLIPVSAWVLGFTSGLVTSSRLSGRQFLAENAHRLPTTVQGCARAYSRTYRSNSSCRSWYFYQKTKNYRVMYGGVVGGLKAGTRLGAWTAAFVGLEEGVEYGVHRLLPGNGYSTRWASGGVAGLGLAAAAGQLCESTRLGRYCRKR